MAITYLSGQRVQGLERVEGTAYTDIKPTGTDNGVYGEDYANILFVEDTANAGKKITTVGLKVDDSGSVKFAIFNNGNGGGTANRPYQKLGGKGGIGTVGTGADPKNESFSATDGYVYATYDSGSEPTIPSNGKFWIFYCPNSSLEHYTYTASGYESVHCSGKYGSDASGWAFDYSTDPIPATFVNGTHYANVGSLGGVFAYTTATSGDVKPTDVPTGSQFEETDTRKFYQFDGTNWIERGTAI